MDKITTIRFEEANFRGGFVTQKKLETKIKNIKAISIASNYHYRKNLAEITDPDIRNQVQQAIRNKKTHILGYVSFITKNGTSNAVLDLPLLIVQSYDAKTDTGIITGNIRYSDFLEISEPYKPNEYVKIVFKQTDILEKIHTHSRIAGYNYYDGVVKDFDLLINLKYD